MQHQPKLEEAAKLATEAGVALDEFMRAAWNAFVDSHPGMREEIEEARVLAGLEEMRRRGMVAEA